MQLLRIIPVLFEDEEFVNLLLPEMARIQGLRVFVDELQCDVDAHYSHTRGQFNAASMLGSLEDVSEGAMLLVLTSVDIYIPIFTFVFGAARLGGRCAIVSSHRLHSEYYGLPPDRTRLHERLLKECIHEIGHCFGLRHCVDSRCVMSSSTSADELDIKGIAYCRNCKRQGRLPDV